MSELKPCPFCGGEAESKICMSQQTLFSMSKKCIYIMCKECEARTAGYKESVHYSAEEKAIETWNRRTES